MSKNGQLSRSNVTRHMMVVTVAVCAAVGLFISLFLLASSLIKGCIDRHGWTIRGTVYSEENIVESYVLGGHRGQEKYDRIEGASVHLARDESGSDVVSGTQTVTDGDGSYSIFVPRGGYYYLVVKKEGYASLVRRMGIGPMEDYESNEVILKKSTNEKRANLQEQKDCN